MLMPIVSMNKMAMNESVATTCCYRQAATPTALYWEVLHGGWIGNGYTQGSDWVSGYSAFKDTPWMSAAFGRDLTGGTDAQVQAFMSGNTLIYGQGPSGVGGWYVNQIPTTYMSLETQLAQYGFGTKTCDHSDPSSCRYKYYWEGYVENYHFEATSAHAGKSNWASPHTTVQYNS